MEHLFLIADFSLLMLFLLSSQKDPQKLIVLFFPPLSFLLQFVFQQVDLLEKGPDMNFTAVGFLSGHRIPGQRSVLCHFKYINKFDIN